MSEKTARQLRKGLNKIERKAMVHKKKVAEECVRELLNSPFKYRFLFAMKVLFRRRK
ncbi:MAG: hypothetical protein IKP60_07170 [Treponema sp.]|nr:hypothetical protein [Treponema sp.]